MPLPKRVENEIKHSRVLAEGNPESVWGWGTPAGRLRAERRAGLIVQGAGLQPGMRVLEIGCGTGVFTKIFAHVGVQITAIDISSELISKAKSRNFPVDQVRFLENRFEDCDLEISFDAIVGSSVLHHLDIGSALGKIYHLLKPGGRFSFAEPNMLNPQVAVLKNIPWIKRRFGESPDETAFVRWPLKRRLMQAGFSEVNITPFDWLHPAAPHTLINLLRSLGHWLEITPILREFSGSLIICGRRPVGH